MKAGKALRWNFTHGAAADARSRLARSAAYAVYDPVDGWLRLRVGAYVENPLGEQIWHDMEDRAVKAGASVGTQLGDALWFQVRNHAGAHLRARVWGRLWDLLGAQACDQVVDDLRVQIYCDVEGMRR